MQSNVLHRIKRNNLYLIIQVQISFHNMKRGKISSWIWLFLLLLTTFYASIQVTALDPMIMRQVLPAYAILENVDLLNSSRCGTEVDEFRNAVDKKILWVLRGK